MPNASVHEPVLVEEVLHWLRPAAGQRFVDGTLGGGGHTRRLVDAVGPDGLVLAVDRDAAAIERASEEFAGMPVCLAQANYSDIPELLEEIEVAQVDGILLDLGLSSDQLKDTERGFSFQSTGPLDLRFDTSRGEPAWKLLEKLSSEQLADVIYNFGEERLSRRIARSIVERRRRDPVRSAAQLAELVARCVPRSQSSRIHPATRTFQALRIAVNEELKWLEVALKRLPACLSPGGRLAIISFHSLEDRMVKTAFREDKRLEVLTKRPITPGEAEVIANPRARSAKLRIAERAE